MNIKLTEAQKKALNTVSTVFQTAYLLGDVHPSALAALARKGLVERKWSEGSLRGDGRWSYRLSGRGVVALRKIEREDIRAEAARAAVISDQITADQESATETRYEVECQEECNDGTMHEATYSHDTYGKKVYVAVCNGYEDTYTEDVVQPVQVPQETPEALGLGLRQAPEVQDTKTELVTIKLPDGSEQSRRFDLYGDGSELALFLSEVVGRSYRNLNQESAGRRDDGTQVWLLMDHRGDVRATVYKKRGITQ